MKSVIIYKGKYGATEQYANWLAEEMSLPVNTSRKPDLKEQDVLIIGSSVYIGKLTIRKWIKRNAACLAGKKIFLFIVCGTPVTEKQKLDAYVTSSVPAEILKNCTVYFLPGRLTYKKLSFSDKLLLRIGYFLSSKQQKENMHLTDYDSVKRENLNDMLVDIKKVLQGEPALSPA